MDEALATLKRPTNNFIFISISVLAFILALVLLIEVNHLHRLMKQQQTDINTQINTLQTNTTQITNSLKDIQSAQLSLKQTQAASASLAVIELQRNLLQGQNKDILLDDFNSILALSTPIHSTNVSSALNQLEHAINNLPTINPAAAIATLTTLQGALSNLNFVISTPTPAVNSISNQNHSFSQTLSNIWQELKSLIIVRSDNAIGAQLVSEAARFDAIRQLNLLTQEAQWQILTLQDPSNTLTQLKIAISAYTQNDQKQAAWLAQLSQLMTGTNFYTKAQIQPVLTAINNLQQALSLQ